MGNWLEIGYEDDQLAGTATPGRSPPPASNPRATSSAFDKVVYCFRRNLEYIRYRNWWQRWDRMGKNKPTKQAPVGSTPNLTAKLESVDISDSATASPTTRAAVVPDPGPSISDIRVNADVGRSTIRPPNPLHPGDDYYLWACRAKSFLRGLNSETASAYLISLLDDAALRQLMSTGVMLEEPVEKLFEALQRLFGYRQPPALALESFWNRRQHTGESADSYVGALRELSLLAFPEESAERRELEILKRFTLGVANSELYAKFIRKQYTSLSKALEVARGFEAAELVQRESASAQVYA
ncbi:unnamed protein product, partial [Dibothriocephalus latus]